jgi:hypothetical protein
MGELSGTFMDSPEGKIAADRDQPVAPPDGKVKTDVEGVFADAVNKRDNLPVFKVSQKEFYQNMKYGRKRLRFKNGTETQKFMQKSRYNAPFWIQDEKDGYMRKIK